MNLNLGQPFWTKLWREAGIFLGPAKDVEEQLRKFSSVRSRTQVQDLGSGKGTTKNWVLNGVRIGALTGTTTGNTDESGNIIVEVLDETPSSGHATINLYKATGRGSGDKIATGNGADSTTITLTAANSSGVTGTVDIPVISATQNDDTHYLRIVQDWPVRALHHLDGSERQHDTCKTAHSAACITTQTLLQSARIAWRNAFVTFVVTRVKDGMVSGFDTAASFFQPQPDQGRIDTLYSGVLETTRVNMIDDSTAQTVAAQTFTAGAGVFASNNSGKGAMSAPSIEDWALAAGSITFTCSDATFGQEAFTVSYKATATGASRQALQKLTINRLYSDPVIGIHGALLTRTLALTGSGNDYATAADYTITGERSGNTGAGVLYLKTVAGTIDPAKFVTNFYLDANFVTLVAYTAEGAANAVVGINPNGSSGLGGTAKIGTSPTVGHTGSLNLQGFQVTNTNGISDTFTVAITQTAVGEFQDYIGKLVQYHVNGGGSPTILDAYLTAGTFSPFSVRDA